MATCDPRELPRRRFLRCPAALLLGALLAGCGDLAPEPESGDLLVFAPHPDDEVLGCAGIVRQALSKGRRVKIAIFTNGDGFPGVASLVARKPADRLTPEDFLELARFRQLQSMAALRALGGKPGDLVFFGYPDSALDQVYRNRGASPVEQKFTKKTETYGVVQPDHHHALHGRSAPYTYDSALADAVDLIQTFKPGRICVTSEADRHPDHQAAFRFVRDAVRATAYGGAFETYLIHGGPEWPWPVGITPQSPFDAHPVKGERVPLGVPWPPPLRIPLSTEDARFKLAAIQAHATHLAEATEGPFAEERTYLESFVKSEEVFWPAGVP